MAAALGAAATVVLGLVMPWMLAPASKSSPLFLTIAAALSFAAVLVAQGQAGLARMLRDMLRTPEGLAGTVLLAFMLATVLAAHNPAASLSQFGQFAIVIAAGAVLGLCLPSVVLRRRALLFAAGILLTAATVYIDLSNGMWLRSLTGGREMTYAYNRALVTLTVLIWPFLALALAARKLWLVVPVLVILPLAVFKGESATAVLALLGGLAVFPIAFLLPRFTRWAGLGCTLALVAVQPWFGTLMQRLLSQGFHQRFESAHSSDRVDIWLSFEAAARAKWLFGSGFGASLNLQNAPVAALVPPERVVLLGSSHPHNAFLQIWVELGLTGAVLVVLLIILLFQAIGRTRPGLQPFVLTWFAVTAMVALISHGAWQSWWWAAIAASAVGFVCLEYELRRGAPPT
jgi:exopolysaccharide production protein ExoQ